MKIENPIMNHESQPVEPNSALKLLKLPLGYFILHKRDLVLKAGTEQEKLTHISRSDIIYFQVTMVKQITNKEKIYW